MTNPSDEPPRCPFVPPETIPDRIVAPDNTILFIPDIDLFTNPPHFVKAGKIRDWWTPFFYNCLPIVFGNQHGFLMLATYDFVVRWNGDKDVSGLKIHLLEKAPNPNYVLLDSHFGHGILTVQSRYAFRTPKGVNLLVKEPPNYYVNGLSWMNAVIEADNLRRDFTFNIKITQPDLDIYVPKGTPLGCILPYPRYFLDRYRMEELKDPKLRKEAQKTISYFGTERSDYDHGVPRRRYMEGIDIYNQKFEEHQKSLDMGQWWHSGISESESENPDASNSEVLKEGEPAEMSGNESPEGSGGHTRNPDESEKIVELKADLDEKCVSLYLPPGYDKTLVPIKADKHHQWWEEDAKTKNQASSFLPLTMAAGVGWYILSPATFTVDWCGDDDHDAKIEIVEASSHAVIDNHSAHGSFTIQTGFIPRTKKPGDFVYVKGVADQYRLPYYLLEALIAAWWTTSNFELVCLISRPGKFTIEKGQPLAQMFVVDAEHALYDVSLKDGYPPPLSFHKEQ